MVDAGACAVLTALNLVVAYLNYAAWYETSESRDVVAMVAWIGSGAYWFAKLIVSLVVTS